MPNFATSAGKIASFTMAKKQNAIIQKINITKENTFESLKTTASGVIIHVMVVGFHHKKGSQVEYVYPPLSPVSSPSDQTTILLPLAWKDLPSLALPDGAHKYDNDVVFFHLPSIDEPKRTIFAVSCLQQVESSNFKSKDQAVTRSSVLKSITILSAVPLFGLISSKVALATHVWFRQEDFSDVDLLKDLYKSLTVAAPSPTSPDISVLSIDLDLRATITKLGKKLIRLFKVLLLEPKMMFLIEPTADMSRTILGFLSLYPGMLEKGLLLSAISPHLVPPSTPLGSSSSKFSDPDQLEVINASDVQSSIDMISRSLVSDSHGFPLAVFGPENACLPYVSVSYLERLPALKSYLIGCTNILYLHKCDHDVAVLTEAALPGQQHHQNKDKAPSDKLKITFKDRLLKKIAKATPSDERFIGWLLKTVENDTKQGDPYFAGSNWLASDEWIREQFRLYLLGLFSAVANENERAQESYGSAFVTAWRRSLNYSVWQRTVDREKFPPSFVHPGDDPAAAGNFAASSHIFGSTSFSTFFGASSIASVTSHAVVNQLSSKTASVQKAAEGAKKFLSGKAGGLASSLFGSSGHISNHHSLTPPALPTTSSSSSSKPNNDQRPYSSSVSGATNNSSTLGSRSSEPSGLSVHDQPQPNNAPESESIDDRGGESNAAVIKANKVEEAESQL